MIIYKKNVIDIFDELVFELHRKEYFGFLESSEIFVEKIVDYIDNNIDVFPSRKTPQKLIHFGENYIFYKSNQRTTWYIFFEKSKDQFLVTSIINSHCEEVKWL